MAMNVGMRESRGDLDEPLFGDAFHWYDRPFKEWYEGELKLMDVEIFCCSTAACGITDDLTIGHIPVYRTLAALLCSLLGLEGYSFLQYVCNHIGFFLIFIAVTVCFTYGIWACLWDDEDCMFPSNWSNAKKEKCSPFWCWVYVMFSFTEYGIALSTVLAMLLLNFVSWEKLFDMYCIDDDKRFR
uniref:Uncharacterized protein n=2 Tax=Phaeomonas parva TaxID=124430 RepID=A0A7S1XNW0_9STRA|mmetsp:Transcript_20298/g.61649  ORF Transcript_20298/g.61649 Transcript_20298/m.61649 type:complete len:185 (+) Transcript_20298:113-667(+)